MSERVEMINWITGTVMSVPADLVDKYLAAGHKLAAPSPAPVTEAPKPRKPRSKSK